MTRRKLGELLVDRNVVSEQQLMQTISEQRGRDLKLGELLLANGVVAKESLVAVMQEILRTPYLDASLVTPEESAVHCMGESLAVKHCVLPLRIAGKVLEVVMAEPQNLAALDELKFATGLRINSFFGFRTEIRAAIARAYGREEKAPTALATVSEIGGAEVEFLVTGSARSKMDAALEFQAEQRGQRTEAVILVSEILSESVRRKASDIHIEQLPSETVVRLRIDGVLRELRRVTDDLRAKLVSRIKILADLDITERRVSQDGRFLVRIAGQRMDVRVSTLPTQNGEKVVMRLLDPRAASVPFEGLGLMPAIAAQLTRVAHQPQGMILVTGPTGSGKSTTLYSTVNLIRSGAINITTIEDPVEYVIEGLNQVQVDVKAGRTFSGCLRSMLRQDPNVVLVGEIRDSETAEIALTAAQTGHLLLSTMHTNDSVSAVTRLADLGVPPFLVANSLSAVLAQRLVRKLCEHCRVLAPVDERDAQFLEEVGATHMPKMLFAPKGCSHCDNEGYRGRIGVFELLVVDEAMAEAVRRGTQDEVLRDLAIGSGMVPMMEDAIEKVAAGLTTVDEVSRVIPQSRRKNFSCRSCHQVLAPVFRYCPYCATRVLTTSAAEVLNGVPTAPGLALKSALFD